MARLGCKCGELLSNGLCPNDIQLYAFTDKQSDKILANDSVDTVKLFTDLVSYEAWLCPSCKRLYVFGEDKIRAKYIYRLEDDN